SICMTTIYHTATGCTSIVMQVHGTIWRRPNEAAYGPRKGSNPPAIATIVRDPDFQPERCGHRAIHGRKVSNVKFATSRACLTRIPQKVSQGPVARASRHATGSKTRSSPTLDRAGSRLCELAYPEGRGGEERGRAAPCRERPGFL